MSSKENLEQIVQEQSGKIESLQAQLAHAGKLATLGTIGAGVAHELNNPLTVVCAEADEILDSIREGYETNETTLMAARNIKECALRMRIMIDHIRQYSRDDSNAQWEKLDINDPIRDSLILFRRQLENSGIVVRLSLMDNLPRIWGHRNKLESVFQNLIGNSRDAFEQVDDDRVKKVTIRTERQDNDKIVVTVTDNADGVPKEFQANIFEAYFTTKAQGKGTGLGLSIAHQNVTEHKGDIVLKSKQGVGSEFMLTFPLERRSPKNR